MNKLTSISQTLTFSVLAAVILLTPVFFLPLSTNYFAFPKQILLLLLTAVGLVSWLVYSISIKSIRLTLSPMLLPLLLFTGSVIASTFISSPDKMSAWLGYSSLVSGLFVYYLLFTTILKSSKQVKQIINGLLIVSVFTAVLGLLSFAQAFSGLNWPAYLTNSQFSPLGSSLMLISFLFATLPLSLTLAFKTKVGPSKFAYFIAAGIQLSAAIIIGSQFLPGRPNQTILLSKLASWSIAIDTFKTSFFLGSGPGSFINQFTQFKPISINQSDLWTINFNSSGNEIFQLLTTLGMIGTLLFGLLIFSWYKLVKKDTGTRTTSYQMAVNMSVAAILVLSLLIPFSNVLWIMLVSLLALSVGLNKSKNVTKVKDVIISVNAITLLDPDDPNPQINQQTAVAQNLLPWFLTLPVAIGLFFTTSFFYKAYAADVYYMKSLLAAQANDGAQTYNMQIKAIETMPNLDRYRLAYSGTNLALANSLSQVENPTDQDKETITQLVQQSVREARLATQLNPASADNWINLANVYRQLVNFAEGADQFAIASYVQAIRLDPANPRLRLDLGGLLFNLEQYEDALDRFNEAVSLKNDYANAYYNLAVTYKALNKALPAYQALQQVLALLPADSEDAKKVTEELQQLEAQLPAPTTPQNPQAEQLTQPSPLPQAPKNLEPINVEEPIVEQPASPTTQPTVQP